MSYMRERHDAVCSKCGNECVVPFIPAPNRPIYCHACYQIVREERANLVVK
jgi:CxxC-x17-CxxC domain-containing protein